MEPSLEPGAVWTPESTRFVVWAPFARSVTLRLLGPVHRDVPMKARHRGYHIEEVAQLAPGQRYAYRLDSGPDRPDPASRWQPDGVHRPSAIVDPTFVWHDEGWQGIPMRQLILYETHIGTFTPIGTFDSAIGQLDRLRHLGINGLSLMPLAQFPGVRNWGYDGTFPFAVQHSYGGMAGLKRFVDAAHSRGLAVILDVVYNHLGPEGNYLREFGPYFTDQYKTPWGDPLNFDGPHSDEVRNYFLTNALRWLEEFHLDGLRIDAVPFIKDCSAYHFLAELADLCHAKAKQLGRHFVLIGESDMNDPKILRPREQNGWGLDSQWSDDFHNALHAYLTLESGGYYADYGPLESVAACYQNAYWNDGRFSPFRNRRYGTQADDRPGEQFVIFNQNHDQVGNRPRGDRLSTLVDFETQKLLAAFLLTSPYVPMIFMGEEYGETAPFPFFVNHSDGRLLDLIRKGRKREFSHFGWQTGDIADPADERTFQSAKLRTELAETGRGAVLTQWHRELIRLRCETSLSDLDRSRVSVSLEGPLIGIRRAEILMAFNFGTEPIQWAVQGNWTKLFSSSDERWQGTGRTPDQIEGEVTIPGRAALGLRP